MRLNEGAEVLLQTNRTLRLVRGQMWSTVARAEAPFKVEVPEATVTALGTKFDLLCKPEETTLTVVEGATRVKGKGSDAIVRGGYSLKIKGGDLGKAGRSDVLFATNWVLKLLVLKDVTGDGIIDALFGSADGNVYAVSGVDGKLLWKLHTNGRIDSALTWGPDGGLIVGSADRSMTMLDVALAVNRNRSVATTTSVGPSSGSTTRV